MNYSFYHLTASPLEKALPRLMEKVVAAGKRAVILTPDEGRMQALNAALWSFTPNSFLPHGSRLDPFPDEQPVYLTDREENPNGADVLVLTGGRTCESYTGYAKVLDLFDAASDDEVAQARARFKARKAAGDEVAYYQQTTQGGWEKKAG